MNSPVNIRIATAEEVHRLYREHMSHDFPPNELKPLPLLLTLMQQGINSIWLATAEDAFVGYAVLAAGPNPRVLLLDYLAVDAARRDQGWGSLILQTLQRQWRDCTLLIESEHPSGEHNRAEYQKRSRRIAFYRRAGAQLSGVRSLLFGVDYDLLQLGTTLSPESLRREYLALYQNMLPPERLSANLRIISSK